MLWVLKIFLQESAKTSAEHWLPTPESIHEMALAWWEKNALPSLITVVILLSISLSVVGFLYNRLLKVYNARTQNEKARKVVLFVSPCPDGQFYLQHLSSLVRRASQHADTSLTLCISFHCPAETFQNNFIPEMSLASVDDYPAIVSGVFMIPADPDHEKNQEGIKAFKLRYPTVLLDVYPGTATRSDLPYFVGGDENQGGKLAAQLAETYLSIHHGGKVQEAECRVLILKGRSTKWEMQRVEAFRQSLVQALPKIEIKDSHYLNYNRHEARKLVGEVATNGLKRLFGNYLPIKKLDIIYACNDEMAIGALEALEAYAKIARLGPKHLPKIIGYDGTPEMKRLIEQGNPYILGTIDVDVEEQADRAIGAMMALLKDEVRGQGTVEVKHLDLVQPSLVTNRGLFPVNKS